MYEEPEKEKRGLLGRFFHAFTAPSAHYSLGALLLYGFALGVVFWGSFHWAIELSNSEAFCVYCHEHSSVNLVELKQSVHYSNESGIRATCHNCHVPEEWVYKVARKIYVTNELFHHLMGSLSTPEKYEAKRLKLAEFVWDSMRRSDSRECRSCHTLEAMNLRMQEGVAARQHKLAAERGVTCIDCHKGVAHHLPAGTPERKLLTEAP